MSKEFMGNLKSAQADEMDYLDYLAITVKHWRMILILCSLAVITAVTVSSYLPKTYRSSAVIMPPKSENQPISGLISKLGGLASITGGALGESNPSYVYVEMLKSCTVQDAVIEKLNLMEVYRLTSLAKTRRLLTGNTKIKISRANTIRVVVEAGSPELAANIANEYLKELDRLNRRLTVSDAILQREFLEKRIKETKQQLAGAEVNLMDFQERNKIVALKEQAVAAIRGAAEIKGQIIATETDLKVSKSFATGKSMQIVRLEQKLEELKAQLARIETGHSLARATNQTEVQDSNYYIPFIQVPELALKYSRLRRQVKLQESVFELLTQQHELARIAVSKDASTVQILDKALVPEEWATPDRTEIVLLTGIVCLFLSVFLAFILEYFERIDQRERERWLYIKSLIKGSIPFAGEVNA